MIDETCGIKKPLDSPAQFIRDLADAITLLGRDEALRCSLAQGALKRAREFTWEKKARQVHEIYQAAIDTHRLDKR